MEFAVKSPAQDPHVGQPWSSSSFNPAASSVPRLYGPTPSKMDTRSTFSPVDGSTPARVSFSLWDGRSCPVRFPAAPCTRA